MEHFYQYCVGDDDIPLRALWRFLLRAGRRSPDTPERAWDLRFCRALVAAFNLDVPQGTLGRLMASDNNWSVMQDLYLSADRPDRAIFQVLRARTAMSAPGDSLEGFIEGNPFASDADKFPEHEDEIHSIARRAIEQMGECKRICDEIDVLLFKLVAIDRDPDETRKLSEILLHDPELSSHFVFLD